MTKTPEELTEEWYSKKLQTGSFWFVETKDGYPEPMVVDMDGDFEDYEGNYYSPSFSKGKLKVLAPCNYTEYKAMQEQLNKEGVWYTKISYNKLEKGNNNLRDLLRECKPYLSYFISNNKHVGLTPNTTNLLTCINAALNETQANPADNIKIQESEE